MWFLVYLVVHMAHLLFKIWSWRLKRWFIFILPKKELQIILLLQKILAISRKWKMYLTFAIANSIFTYFSKMIHYFCNMFNLFNLPDFSRRSLELCLARISWHVWLHLFSNMWQRWSIKLWVPHKTAEVTEVYNKWEKVSVMTSGI